MTLIAALKNQGLTNEEIKETINEMLQDLENGADPIQIMKSYGLHDYYTQDLFLLSDFLCMD